MMDREKNFKKYVSAVAGRNMMIVFLIVGVLLMFAAGPVAFLYMGFWALIVLSKNPNVILGYDANRQKQFRALTKK